MESVKTPTAEAKSTSMGDRIEAFLSRVRDAISENPLNEILRNVMTESQISKMTHAEDQEYWSSAIKGFDEYVDSLKTVSATKVTETKESFKEKLEKESTPAFTSSKHWGDYSTSSEDEEMLESIRLLSKGSKESQIIRLPYDLEEIWPRGYKVLTSTAEKHGLTCLPDKDVSMVKNGFTESAALSMDRAAFTDYIAGKTQEQCNALSTLMTLVYFLRIQPTEWLAKSNQYALTACYALHFLIKGETEEEQELIAKSLKHTDGGKSLIGIRIGSLFKTGSSAPSLLLNSVDRLYRLVTQNYQVEDEDEYTLVLTTCFTSRAGLVRSFYRHETRREMKAVEEIKPSGKKVTTRKEVLVRGLVAPKMHLGSEFLKDEETSSLKKYEKTFPNEVSILSEQLERVKSKDFLLPAKVCKIIVDKAYAISDRISKVIKRRKEETRVRALSKSTDKEKKVTQPNWVSERNLVVKDASPLDQSIYTDIERFREGVAQAIDSLM